MNRKHSSLRLLGGITLALALATGGSTRAATFVWTNTAGGNWNVPANWQPNQVPGAADTASITTPGSYGLSVTDNESVSNLVLGAASGTLTLNILGGTFTVNGTGSDSAHSALVISGGAVTGSGSIVAGGPLTWTGGSINGNVSVNGGSINVPASSALDNGGELINTGPLAWTPNSGPRTGTGAVISNAPSGVISVALNGNNIDSYNYGGPTAFYNAGTINVSGSGQSGFITDPFFNTGTVNVNSGTLSLTGGGTSSSGIFVAAGATLAMAGGTYNFSSGSTITGAGTNNFSSGTVNFLGTSTVTGMSWLVSGATVNLNGSGNLSPTMLILNNGALAGSYPLLIPGQLTWTGGSINGNISVNGGSINVPASSALDNGGELINTGPLAWTPNSGPRTGTGAVISNAPSGVISVALNGNNIDSYNYGGPTAFYNAGTINVSGSGQSGFITDPFFNTGTVNVNSGTLSLTGGGTSSSGIFVAAGATLAMAGGTYNFSSGSTITGAGTNNFSSGTVNFLGTSTVTGMSWLVSGATVNLNGSGNLSPTMLILNNGALAGSYPLLIPGQLTWTGGSINGNISVNGGSINVPASSALDNGGELINTGPLAWTPNSGPRTGTGAVISNAPSGVISVALNGNNIDSYNYGGPTAFYNAGTINVSGSGQSGFITDPFFNTGTVNVNSGTLSLTGGASLANGTLDFGINSASNFGRLAISGPIAISGTLGATANGYTPSLGDSFPLITYGSKSGGFASFHLPSGINWQQTYGPTVYTISVDMPTNFSLAISQPAWTTNGFNLTISGPVGANYTVLLSTNLVQTNWSVLTSFVSTFTQTPFTDTNATRFGTNRFYRAFTQ